MNVVPEKDVRTINESNPLVCSNVYVDRCFLSNSVQTGAHALTPASCRDIQEQPVLFICDKYGREFLGKIYLIVSL